MPVIAILNTKGGSGKTTIATNLAHALQLRGKQVTLVDSDPQGSVSDWARNGGQELLAVTRLTRPTLDRDIRKAMSTDDWVVIDGAPQVDELAAAAIRAADVVLVPIQPSPYDVWAAAPVVEAIKQRQSTNQGKPKAALVVSRAIVGTALANDIDEGIAGYGLPVFKSRTHQRVLYAETVATGQTVVEDTYSQAAQEIQALTDELEAFING